jgi:hypothetical protein
MDRKGILHGNLRYANSYLALERSDVYGIFRKSSQAVGSGKLLLAMLLGQLSWHWKKPSPCLIHVSVEAVKEKRRRGALSVDQDIVALIVKSGALPIYINDRNLI